jgi:putative oxidoreductase
MAGFMRNYSGETYALLRIVAGFLFFWHGSQKILGFPPYPTPEAAAQAAQAPAVIIWTAGLIELIGGLLVMVGLFTRAAAFLASGLMGFAYWMAHGFNAPLPIQNHGELAAIYCFVFLYISARGGGKWSFDGGE